MRLIGAEGFITDYALQRHVCCRRLFAAVVLIRCYVQMRRSPREILMRPRRNFVATLHKPARGSVRRLVARGKCRAPNVHVVFRTDQAHQLICKICGYSPDRE